MPMKIPFYEPQSHDRLQTQPETPSAIRITTVNPLKPPVYTSKDLRVI